MSKKINEEIISETEDRPTLKAVNELTAEDVAIKEYLKAVYKTKSKQEVEQLSRQLWNKAREEGEKTLLKKASLKLVNGIVYSVPHKAWIVFTKEQRVSFIDLIKRTIISSEEVARQSALAEKEGLKKKLEDEFDINLKLEKEVMGLKQQLADLKIKITHLESTLQFERSKMHISGEYELKKEQVRKLKEVLTFPDDWGFYRARKPEKGILMKKIDEIFSDCAEHTNELNADFRKFAKKTLSGEKR